MPQQYKIDKVNDLKSHFEKASDFIFTSYRGLTVEKITELRKRLRPLDSKYVVIKNNYIKVIGKEKGVDDFGANVKGPTAVAFAEKDVNEVAKALFAFKEQGAEQLEIKGAYIAGKVLNADEIKAVSKLPGRNQLLAMVMATMNAPLQNFVYATNDVAGRFVRVVDAVRQQKEGK